jgi:pimeloyl-ACP methyl ester carboxylesterase
MLEYELIHTNSPQSPMLVFLHEGLGCVALWKDFPRRVATATGCNALLYSRQGYGDSAALQGPRSPDYLHHEALTVLPQLLDRFDIRDPLLFGHSDGASIALIHAAGAARAVRGLVLMAPHVKVEEISVGSIAAARQTYENTDLRTRLARYHADPDAAFRGWCDIWLDPRFRAWNIEDLIGQIRCPMLAIQGFDDEYGTMEQIDSIARRAPGTQLLKLKACAHSPHRDQPEAVIAAAARFLGELAPHPT